MADRRPGSAPSDRRRTPAAAAASWSPAGDRADRILDATRRHWDLTGDVPVPRPGWLACPVCRQVDPLIRLWRFHVRPGTPTVPWRCDVHFKCRECAHGWWHGVAIPLTSWERRPRPTGLRAVLTRGSNFEPAIFTSNRTKAPRHG